MCGRTACTLAPDEVSRACSYRTRGGQRRRPRWRDGDADSYKPSYNKSPQTRSPVLLSQRHFDKEAPADECVLASMRWGLVPAWCREKNLSKMQYSTTNCRSENILEKKTFKDPLIKGQRCVILADGFYEWQKVEKDKQPFFIYFPQTEEVKEEKTTDDVSTTSMASEKASETTDEEAPAEWTGWRLLTMAGVFDCWTPPEGGEPLYTYSVITVEASPNLQSIHNRMPAILDGEEEVSQWLDFGTVKSSDALKLLQPKNVLSFHPVSSFVNNSRNNSAECLQPVDPNSKKYSSEEPAHRFDGDDDRGRGQPDRTEPKPTASSKMMMSWLKTSSTEKRKEPDCSEGEKEQEVNVGKSKPTGALKQWLQGANKKPRTQ